MIISIMSPLPIRECRSVWTAVSSASAVAVPATGICPEEAGHVQVTSGTGGWSSGGCCRVGAAGRGCVMTTAAACPVSTGNTVQGTRVNWVMSDTGGYFGRSVDVLGRGGIDIGMTTAAVGRTRIVRWRREAVTDAAAGKSRPPDRGLVGAARKSIAVAIRQGAGPGCRIKDRHQSAGLCQSPEDDSVRQE